MRLLIVRHAEPDYARDTITKKGRREAELLAERLSRLPVSAVYCSPLGRAKDTAAPTLQKLGMRAQVLPWLEEFPCRVNRPDGQAHGLPWDLPDSIWTAHPLLYDKDRWTEEPFMTTGDGVKGGADRVWQGLDALLESHGYKRRGPLYEPVRPNKDTILLFCHLGVQFVMLSHLCGVAAPVLWQNFCVLPSRVQGLGDLSHLYAGGEAPSPMGFFREVFTEDDYFPDLSDVPSRSTPE